MRCPGVTVLFVWAMSELLLGEDGGSEVEKWIGSRFRSGNCVFVRNSA